ncbi:MAG: lysoplasmalogenase family protein [Clostridiaceae bacterium]|jgi:uncharacterized membrane protein YhhN|nr:lysoplasmalogenase family protein [Clostridiaceae bacterium]
MPINYYFVTLFTGIAVTALFLILRVKKGGFWGLFSKTMASVCFIATALAAANQKTPYIKFASLMIMGFVFGMLGDIWLDLKWMYTDDVKKFLYAGFISFLIGHICFVSAIVMYSPCTFWSIVVAIALALVIATVAVLLEKPMKLKYGKYKLIVFIYSTTLSMTLTFSAVTAYITNFEKIWVVMTIGAALFLFSDLVLSGMYFSDDKNKNTPVNVVVNHTLYYAAQFILASAIHFVK